jgi:hypothetical protein
MRPDRIDDAHFASEAVLQQWCDRIGGAGFRGTGTVAHERVIAWVESELAELPGVAVRADEFDVLRWQPVPEGDLEHAGALRAGSRDVAVAGAVPYTLGASRRGPLVRLGPGEQITAASAAGKVVLRDFPEIPLPYDALLGLGLHATADCEDLRGQIWDRPGLADGILHDDLLAAGAAGAAGVIFAFDLPREQVAGYFEPHKGTHYRVPAVFVGVDEREELRQLAVDGAVVEITVRAEVEQVPTRNVIATLPGRSAERIVLVTHTDGHTWVQENGIAALLALARYFSALPLDRRHRTIELAFTTAHLHISREGAARHAAQLDGEYDDGDVAFVFPIEHLGARELIPVPRGDGPGRRLQFTDGSEPVLWAVGPSDALRRAVVDATTERQLERVLVAPGFGAPVEGQVPRIVSFGGLGTYFNVHLIPTTSIITGPWSLWAPAFGAAAIDVGRLRQQALAAGDVVAALDRVPREDIAGDYLADRRARSAGAPVGIEYEPPEVAPG